MNISDIQSYVAGLLVAHPKFSAAGLALDNSQVTPAPDTKQRGIILDDGTYPKIPGLEDALSSLGLALVVWRVGNAGILGDSKTGAVNLGIYIAVVIQENVAVNQANGGTGIKAEDALQYVIEAVSGKPKKTPPGTPIHLFHEPFENMGTSNGVQTIVVNFIKAHPLIPI